MTQVITVFTLDQPTPGVAMYLAGFQQFYVTRPRSVAIIWLTSHAQGSAAHLTFDFCTGRTAMRRRSIFATFSRRPLVRRDNLWRKRLLLEPLEDRRMLAVGPYLLPLTPLMPTGSLVYETAAEREIDSAGAVDSLDVDIDAGQTVTVLVEPLDGLRAAVEIRDSAGALVGSESVAAAGETLLLQTLPILIADTYTIIVFGVDDSIGGFNGRVLLNAAIEAESQGGAANDDSASAQSLADSFIPLVGSAERAAVVGRLASAADWYRFELADGQSASLALTGSGLSLDLFAADGTTRITAGVDAANADRMINNFVDRSSDGVANTYYARVTGADAEYSLIVTRGADFDTERNDGLPPGAQDISPSGIVLGHAGSGTRPRLFAIPRDSATQIVELDPDSGAEINRFEAPESVSGGPDGLAFDGQSLFFINGSGTDMLWELNPDTGAVIDSDVVQAGSGSFDGLAAVAGKIYILDYGRSDVIEFDPVSDTVTNILDIDALNPGVSLIGGLAAITGPDALIATVGQGTDVFEIDPTSGLVTSSFSPGVGSIFGVAVVEGSIYLGRSSGNTIDIFSRAGLPQSSLALPYSFSALGGDDAGGASADFFNVSVNAGDTLMISTTTPADGLGEFFNNLDPSIELFDPTGASIAVDDNSAADGRNALLIHPAELSGLYTVRVSGAAGTSGEYVLNVSGFSGALRPFVVDSTMPGDGSTLTTTPSTYEVHFSDRVNLSTLDAGDLLINGTPATQIDAVPDGDTVIFTLPALGDGVHSVEIAGGSILDLQGTAIDPFSATFAVDTTGPRVISSSLQEGDNVPAGGLTVTIQFDELLSDASLGAEDVLLIGALTGAHAPDTFNYDGPSSTLNLGYNSLLDDNYTLTLTSGDGAFEDLPGNDLDGEPLAFPIPPNRSGDGVAGGDFVVNFSIDVEVTAYPTPLDSRLPLGSLIYDASVDGAISFASDTDSFTLDVDDGQTITVVVDPDATLNATLELFDPSSNSLARSVSSAAGLDAVLQTVATVGAGTYTVTVGGEGGATGNFTLRVILNAAVEEESHDGPTNDDSDTAQSLADSFIPLVGSAERGAVLGHLASAVSTLYEANMDVDPGWVMQGEWQYGQPTGGLDPVSGFTGPNVVGYNLAGNYPNSLPVQYATTPSFSTLGATDVSLSFMRWLRIESCCDRAAVEVSNDGGISWTNVWSGTSLDSTWMPQTFDISAIADDRPDVRLRWSMGPTDGSVTYTGWNIDDVLVFGSTPTMPDWYRFELADGQSASLALQHLSRGLSSLELYDAAGTRLALDAGRVAQIGPVRDTTSDGLTEDFFVRVSGTAGEYSLVVTRDARLADPGATLDLTLARAALGHLDASGLSRDFTVGVTAGDLLQIATSTPADGAGEFVNLLDPRVELYDPTGTLVAGDDNGAADGRNAALGHTADSSGVYTIRVLSVGGTAGEFVLNVSGHSGSLPAFAVTSIDPADGAVVATGAVAVTVDFNNTLLLSSLDPEDLTIDGVSASAVHSLDHDTVVFEFAATLSSGEHTFRIARGAIDDLQGTPIDPFASTIVIDRPPEFLDGVVVGRVRFSQIMESSGMVASRQNDGVIWVHNDSGDRARLFAMDTTGAHLGIYRLSGAGATDWEDVAIGPGPEAGVDYLYIADTGDNRARRSSVTIYRVREPLVAVGQAAIDVGLPEVESFELVYPDGARDAETLLVDPISGDIVILSKRDRQNHVYRVTQDELTGQGVITLQLVGTTTWGDESGGSGETGATAGDVSPDGLEILIKNYDDVFYYRRDPGQNIAEALIGVEPIVVPYADESKGEAITFDPATGGYFTINETDPRPVYFYERVLDTAPPTAELVSPQDNGPLDADPLEGRLRVNPQVDLQIQLSDLRLDDASVTASTVSITRDAAALGAFSFSYDAASDVIRLLPDAATFSDGSYEIVLNGGADKIADISGNEMPATTFTLLVDSSLLPQPVAIDDAYRTNEDRPLVVAVNRGVLANDGDGQASPLTTVLVDGPTSGSLMLDADGSFRYEPDENFFGTDTFTYRADNGTFRSNLVTVEITVTPVDDPPVAVDDFFMVQKDGILRSQFELPPGRNLVKWEENGHYYGVVTGNRNWNQAFDHAQSQRLFGATGHLVTITSAAENEFLKANVLDPAPTSIMFIGLNDVEFEGLFRWVTGEPVSFTNWNGGEPNNSGGNEDAVDVARSNGWRWNDLGVGSVRSAYVVEFDVVARIGILENDFDADGDVLSVVPVDDVQHGTLQLNSDGSFTYTPEPGFVGVDQFTYRVSAADDLSNLATVTINVNALPEATGDDYQVDEDNILTVDAAAGVLANDSDLGGDVLSAVLVAAPLHGAVELSDDGSFSYTPGENFFGTDTFTYLASDGSLQSDVVSVSIDVVSVNDVPLAINKRFTTEVNTPLEITSTVAPPVIVGETGFQEPAVGARRYVAGTGGDRELGFGGTMNGSIVGVQEFGAGNKQFLLNEGNIQLRTDLVDVTPYSSINVSVGVRTWETSSQSDFEVNEDSILVFVEVSDDSQTFRVTPRVLTGGTGRNDPNDQLKALDNGQFGAFTTFEVDIPVDFRFVRVAIDATNTSSSERFMFDDMVIRGTLRNPNVGLLADDQDVEGDALAAVLVDSPHSGTLELNDDGTFLYTPLANFVGVDRFTYRASDGQELSNVATVTLEVGPQQDAILAADDAYSVAPGEMLSIDAEGGTIANDVDPHGDPLSATLVDDVAHGQLTLGADGSFMYGPEAGFTGSDTFTYRATDDTLISNLATVTITVKPAGTFVAGRLVFYNGSPLDGNDPTVNSLDDAAIATDKAALLPGEAATLANYTSFPGGITGVMIDVNELADPDDIDARQFVFRAGNTADPSSWPLAPRPNRIVVREGAGTGGSDRITLTWPEGALQNTWLQVTLKATGDTGLTEPDVFYFGSAVGDTGKGNRADVVLVDEVDAAAVLAGAVDPAAVDNVHDLNRDARVDAADLQIVEDNPRDAQNGLRLIDLSANTPPADLTGNGFVDFEDLTVLLAAWNQNVSAAEGNLVDPLGTPVNFEDLTVLLAAWTGPGPAASPQPAAAHVTTGPPNATKQNSESEPSHTATSDHFDRLGRRDDVALRRAGRRNDEPISRVNPLRRLQAAAVDRALAEESTPDRERIFRRRAGSSARL
ncbi:MAG: tandem-95 repeat protein [Planctomycetes bacterium]|nr:tandem-95 repeat protein [Planctomycetota bacterium]